MARRAAIRPGAPPAERLPSPPMEIRLTPPPWATHLISDLDDWLRAPRPVTEIVPVTLPDDAYFEYAWLDARGEKRPDPDNPNPPNKPRWA